MATRAPVEVTDEQSVAGPFMLNRTMAEESQDKYVLHRAVQGALLGAIHGLEQHCAGRFAEWNHQALLRHACHVATTFSATEPTGVSSEVAPSHAELLKRGSPLATSVSTPPEAPPSPRAVDTDVPGGPPQQGNGEEHCLDSPTTEGSRAPQLPSPGSAAALPGSDASHPDSDAASCLPSAITVESRAGSMTAVKAAGPLPDCPRQPSAPQAQQLRCPAADGMESMSERLQAALKGPVSLARALAVLAAVHMGAASLGLAAGLGRMPWPLYLIGTRDSFTHHLHAEQSQVRSWHHCSMLCAVPP